jgi:hypothetical protein
MYIRKRDESIEQLSKVLRSEQLSKVITQGYSDVSLSVMADYNKEYVVDIADSKYTAQTMNKLMEACLKNTISSDDLYKISDYSNYTTENEKYVDDFLNSIYEGVSHKTATNCLIAVNYEDCSYLKAIEYIKSGAFYPTNHASLSVSDKVAEELYDIGVNLRACDGFNYCYDVVNLKESLDNHAAVFVTDKSLALTVNNFMKALDWQEFKDTLKDININEYSGNELESKYNDFVLECKSVELYNRLNSELKVFIEDVKREPPDKIVASAYEIVTKEEVVNYCQEKTPFLTLEQYSALMSEENILDNIYEQWCSNGELSGREDIEIVLCETADRIQISLDREEKEPTVQKIEPKLESVMQQKQENVIKPKHKSR